MFRDRELRSRPIPLDVGLMVFWNTEEELNLFDEENFVHRSLAEAPSGMAPEEERVCLIDWLLFMTTGNTSSGYPNKRI